MALVLLQPGCSPLGQFDCLDGYVTTFNGGEVATWGSTTWQGSDEASADVNQDGYVGTTSKLRPAVVPATQVAQRPLFLTDDGTLHYGTLFGEIVGATVGQQATNGVVLGPHTSLGSGKTTLWDKPGLYGVTLDAVDQASNGLVPSNATLTVGYALSFTTAGLLTPAGTGNPTTEGGGTAPTVARLAEFTTNGSLVTTPNYLVAALNSPSGDVSSLQPITQYMAVIWFGGAGGSGV